MPGRGGDRDGSQVRRSSPRRGLWKFVRTVRRPSCNWSRSGTRKPLSKRSFVFLRIRGHRGDGGHGGEGITTKTQRARSSDFKKGFQSLFRQSISSFRIRTPCSLCLCGNSLPSVSSIPSVSSYSKKDKRSLAQQFPCPRS